MTTLSYILSIFIQATPRLTEDTVKQCVDPRLKGEYPPKGVAKVWLHSFYSIPCVRMLPCVGYCDLLIRPVSNIVVYTKMVLFCLLQLAAVAALCVQYESEFRPSMSIVVKALSPLLQHKPQPPPATTADATAPSDA